MKTRLVISFIIAFALAVGMTTTLAQFKSATIPQLQQVSLDSLRKLDTLQTGTAATTLDKSPYWHGTDTKADTVSITGVVIVKPRILTYTLARYNIFIQDTTTGQLWGGLNVLTNDTSAQAQSTLITALDTGMVVTIVGRVTEFGSQPNSLTELFAYNVGFFESPQVISIGTTLSKRPEPKEIAVDSLAVGTKPLPSRGEKYEGMYVVVRNVTVNTVDLSSGRFTFVDASGNQGGIYDGSGWYTLRGHKITGSKYSPPPVGTQLSYVRGVILPQPRTGTAGDYTIMPLYPGPSERTGSTYPGDIKVGKFAPSITNVFRASSPWRPTDAVNVTYRAKDLNTNGNVDSTFFAYKFGSGPLVKTKVALAAGDSLYRFTIPAAGGDSLVSYYVEAYAGGVYGASPDPTTPLFYQIRAAGLTIKDIQFTPYVNGASGFAFDTVTVRGIVTADTSDYKEIPGSGFGANRPRLFMASGTGAWNGIAMFGSAASVGIDTLQRGDSVEVRGIVSELNGRTNIQVLTVTLLKRGATVPAPNSVSISGSGSLSYDLTNPPVSGNKTFEQWEGCLVKLTNPYLVQMNADNALNTGSHFGEFFLSSVGLGVKNSNFGIRVNDGGTNSYYADTSFASYLKSKPWKTIQIPMGAKIAFLTGMLDYSFGFYKLEPRTNADFGAITGVYQVADALPKQYELTQNYPNPFNPSTTIQFSILEAGKVSLKVFNVLGQQVATLVDGVHNAGRYNVTFDASSLSTGVYFYQLQLENFRMVKKMMLLK